MNKKHPLIYLFLFCFTLLLSANTFADTIVDNGSAGTSMTGAWPVSGAAGYYGTNSVWGRNGATYSWHAALPQSETYQVYMWWTQYDSRSTSAPVTITYNGGSETISVNQRVNGGKWNLLGTYSFNSTTGGTVKLSAPGPSPASYSADAVKFVPVDGNTEHIFVSLGYCESLTRDLIIGMLKGLGATQSGADWTYRNTKQNKTYRITFANSIASMKQALTTPGAHIIYVGHSSMGLGGVFVSDQENWLQHIDGVKYIDDDLVFNYSSKTISADIKYLRTKQAYPYFWPIFKDGTSGLMPYRFGDSSGAPPYNYYVSYHLPGSSTYYKVETVEGGAVERFYGSNVPAWFSSNGAAPSPYNSTQQKYFVVNNSSWTPSIQITGPWYQSSRNPGFYGENYHYANTGSGSNKFKWMFSIPAAGYYNIDAWWAAGSDRTTEAPYTVGYSGGSKTVRVNQQINGNRWNRLGSFYFDKGSYSVQLTNAVGSGIVIADAIRVWNVNNPPEVIQPDFRGSPLYGAAPLTVRFINQTTGLYTSRLWNFGDGETDSSHDDLIHTYKSAGSYAVSLKASNATGSNTVTKSYYVRVGSSSYTRAEFKACLQKGNIPLTVKFYDMSSGNIVARAWDFDDGTTGSGKSVAHTYSRAGNYTVTLTVKDSNGAKRTETKNNFIHAVLFEKIIDNVDYPPAHYGSRTIIFRKAAEISESDLKYSRMFYCSCESGHYYIDTFHRGIMFYTLGTPNDREGMYYLQAYLQGKNDYEIWKILQSHEPVFEYFNFNKLPSEQ
jgi:PKD repeat protein